MPRTMPAQTLCSGTPNAFAARHLGGAKELLHQAGAQSTRRKYASGFQRWKQFISLAVERPVADDYLPRHKTTRDVTDLLLAFANYLHADLHLSASGVDTALLGVRNEFAAELIDVSPFADPAVKKLRGAIASAHPPARRGKRAPFTLEMVMSMEQYAREHPSAKSYMIAKGAQLGYFMLMRISEYAITRDAQHTLRAKAVEFECVSTESATESVLIPADRMRGIPFSCVRGVRVSVLTSKTFPNGPPQTSWFDRMPDSASFCFTRSLWEWTGMAEFGSTEDFFLSYRDPTGARQNLRYNAMNDALKACGVRFGLEVHSCGTHSLRVGGSTALEAAGASGPQRQQAGRWKSAPVATSYPARTSVSNNQQMEMLLSPGAFTTRDVRMAQRQPGTPVPARPAVRGGGAADATSRALGAFGVAHHHTQSPTTQSSGVAT